MKKKVLIGLSVLALVALMAVGTWAWFTAETEEPVTNVFTTGEVDIELVDEFDQVDNWNPGDCSDKVINVKNTGTLDAYVRVKLTATWDNEEPTDNVTYGDLGTGWSLGEGDWYYYEPVLAPGASTTNLIDKVCLADETGNEYQGAKLEIDVVAQAVQAENVDTDNLPWP